MMPAMDGYATVARLRDDPETARIPVTIITGQASPTYRPLSEGVGARAHLTKPCSPVRLADTVRRVLTGQPDEPTHLRLGDILLERGVVTPTPLQAALDLQARSGQGLGQILLQMGVVTEETLNWTLSERLRVPYVDLEDDVVDFDLIRPMPEELLRRHEAVPVLRVGNGLTVILAHPRNSQAAAELRRSSWRRRRGRGSPPPGGPGLRSSPPRQGVPAAPGSRRRSRP